MAAALKKAAATPKNDFQKKRLQDVINHFEYTRCLTDRYLISRKLRSEKLSLAEINALRQKCTELDNKFDSMWKNLVSKDKVGVYRYHHKSRPNVDTIYHNYRDVITGFVFESTCMALDNHSKAHCKSMKRKARMDYWTKAKAQYPELLEISTVLSKISGKPGKNCILNGNFKKFKQGDPAVPGAHPQLDNWYFHEQINKNLSEEYKSLWRLVNAPKGPYNHLAIGQGKCPEVRQYMKLEKGLYRFSFSCRPNNLLSFSFNEIADSKGVSDAAGLLSKALVTPEVVSFNCHKARGVVTFSRIIVIPADNWYALRITSPNTTPGTWSRLWAMKLEKLN
jgi:hypothetical protein